MAAMKPEGSTSVSSSRILTKSVVKSNRDDKSSVDLTEFLSPEVENTCTCKHAMYYYHHKIINPV